MKHLIASILGVLCLLGVSASGLAQTDPNSTPHFAPQTLTLPKLSDDASSLSTPVDKIMPRGGSFGGGGHSFGGGGRSFGGGGGRSFGGGGSFGGGSFGSSSSRGSFGGGSSSPRTQNSTGLGSFGRSGSFGSANHVNSTSLGGANGRGGYNSSYGNWGGYSSYGGYGYYPSYGYFGGYSYGWFHPAWYYYTPFYPAFYMDAPYLGSDNMYHPGGFSFFKFILGIVLIAFIIWLLVKLFGGGKRIKYTSYR
jgi:hypothetical protein